MSVEVRVTRRVPDSVWTDALKALYTDCVYRAAGYAQEYAPRAKGTMLRTLNPQSSMTVDGGAWPAWAKYKPKIGNPPYAGYLNAGSYVRTWVPPRGVITKWAQKKGLDGGATWGNMLRRRGKKVWYHYINNPGKSPPKTTTDEYGRRTAGWFDPSVPYAMKASGDMDAIAEAFKARIESAWNG